MKRKLMSAGASMLAIAMFWLLFLPWLGQRPAIRHHVDTLHAAEINASAMFYSELECQHWLQK